MTTQSTRVLPWPCSGCGEGHARLRTYEAMPDQYVCACGVRLDAERVADLLDSLTSGEEGHDNAKR